MKFFTSKHGSKPRLIRWVLLLIEFNIEIHDRKGLENVAPVHLSRLENPNLEDLDEVEINDRFLDEYMVAISIQTPWYSYMLNYHVAGILLKKYF